MSLPAGFLDEIRSRLPLSDVVGRRVSWDARKSNPAKGDHWACCPFHEEKSPSFHVDDRRGFYHCFGCGASGDHVTFLRERENMGFMEAVEALAAEAGLEMPRRDPAAAARAEKSRGLAAVMEEAAKFYRAQLRGAAGRAAASYLRGRGVAEETVSRFELGYAPSGRRVLFEALTARGIPAAQVIEAGLAARPEDGGAPFDRFRDRVMFPIRDAQGRCVAFGGRALSPEARAKYLNSPETPLFDKSRTLYNIGPGRAAAAKAGGLIVVEGYMDAVALAQAGIENVVANLGTALTEHHLRLLWRCAEEPVIALDGDAAGRRAAARVAEMALPLLEPGRSLRVALLPEGLDPDDLARREGAEGVRAVIAAAEPLTAVLWRRETEGRVFDSADRRAALDARLKALLGAIGDARLRPHYEAAFRALWRETFAPSSDRSRRAEGRDDWPARFSRPAPRTRPLPQTRSSALARAPGADEAARGREAAILLTLLNHPALAERLGDAVAAAAFACRDLDALRGALLSAMAETPELDAARLRARLSEGPAAAALSALEAAPTVRALRFARAEARIEDAADGLVELLARHEAEDAAREAEREAAEEAAEPSLARLGAARDRLHAAWPGRLPKDEEDAPLISARIEALLASARRGRKRR